MKGAKMKVDLLNGKLNKTYFTLLFSAIASTIVSTIYSTVDMICVGHYSGEDGAAAIACINPFWALMFAFGVLAGIGGAVMLSNRRGAGNEMAANEYFTVAMAVSGIFSAILLFIGIFYMEEFLRLVGGTDGIVLELAVEYMNAMLFSIPTFTLCATLSTFVRNDGEAVIPTVATIIGGVLNMVLDVYFVFGLDMGIKGAGLATGIGQAVAFAIIVSYLFAKKCTLKFTLPEKIAPILAKICTVGFSAFLIEIASGIVSSIFNTTIFNNLSTAHLAVFGTASTLTIMITCIFSGIGTASQPIISTAFSADKRDRIKGTLRLGFITAIIMSGVSLVLCQLFPTEIIKIYMSVDNSVLDVGPRIMRLYTLALPAISITMVCNYYFQSTLMRLSSVIVSLLRGLILPIAFVFLIPAIAGYDYIWLAIPFAEYITCAVSIVMFLPSAKRLLHSRTEQGI